MLIFGQLIANHFDRHRNDQKSTERVPKETSKVLLHKKSESTAEELHL